MEGRKTLTLGVSALLAAALLGGVLYALRRDAAPEGDARPAARPEVEAGGKAEGGEPPRAALPAVAPPESVGTVSQEAGPPERVDLAPAPVPAVRSRSLASLRGGISRALRSCSPRLTAGPVRVFVSMDAVVSGGKIRPEQVQVRTSSPTSEEFVRCLGEAVRSMSAPAAAGEPDGSFPATVSLLTGGP